jgi:hypothetical protein
MRDVLSGLPMRGAVMRIQRFFIHATRILPFDSIQHLTPGPAMLFDAV